MCINGTYRLPVRCWRETFAGTPKICGAALLSPWTTANSLASSPRPTSITFLLRHRAGTLWTSEALSCQRSPTTTNCRELWPVYLSTHSTNNSYVFHLHVHRHCEPANKLSKRCRWIYARSLSRRAAPRKRKPTLPTPKKRRVKWHPTISPRRIGV